MRNTRVGLTGWLSPEGEFYPCHYQEHYSLASHLIDKDKTLLSRCAAGRSVVHYTDLLWQNQWISMGSKGVGFDILSCVLCASEKGITERQKTWLEDHMDQLDETQQIEAKGHLLDFF